MTTEERRARPVSVPADEGDCATLSIEHESREQTCSREGSLSCFIPGSFRASGLLREMKGAALSVYCAYVSRVGKKKVAWPSLKSLAASTGYGVNCIKSARRRLVELELLIPIEQLRPGGRFGRKNFLVVTEAPKTAQGTVVRKTVAPRTAARKQDQEGNSSSRGLPVGKNNSTRCTTSADGEHRSRSPYKEKILIKKKEESMERRLIQKIQDEDESVSQWREKKNAPDNELMSEIKAAFDAMRFPFNVNDPCISMSFAIFAREVWAENRSKDIPPGILCCKLIDRLQRYRKTGEPGCYWSPKFQRHRDNLRAQERAHAGKQLLAEEDL